MNEITAWISHQARLERGVVRLEDALLANSFGRYFFHRLRFLFARTAISTLFHALKIVLLLGAFPRSEFVVIVIAQAVAALTGDFWWGALEQLRSQIRLLQRRSMRYLVPREIARWLSLAGGLSLLGLFIAGMYLLDRLLTSGLDAVDLYVCVLLAAMSVDLVTRTYHSGAYALRRVYRPLPSLLALDVVSVGALLALWPIAGIWAFPIAELISVVVVVSIALHYTTRTYRTLAMPTLLPLLRLRRPWPSTKSIRAAIAPGAAYAFVGLEAVVVVAGIATATTAAGASLVVLLAALGPVSRASFEWARLLYFDLKRLELPMLADLRRRFDRAIVWLAVVMGLAGALLASAVALVILDGPTTMLIAALVALFLIRSLLAGAQMQAFTRGAYTRLVLAGGVGVAGLVITFFATSAAEGRLVGVSVSLAASLLLLAVLPPPTDPGDLVVAPADWLRRLRIAPQPVATARLQFDSRLSVPGTTAEARRAEAWRREAVGRRLAARVSRRGGSATWVGAHELWLFERDDQHVVDGQQLVGMSAGLVGRPPQMAMHLDPAAAALEFAAAALHTRTESDRHISGAAQVLAEFARRFPNGIAYDTRLKVPAALTAMGSELRVEIYRAAVVFARDLRPGRGPADWEVSALVDDGVLRAIFAVPRVVNALARAAWVRDVRAWTLRSAAGVPIVTAPILPGPAAVAAEVGAGPKEAAML